MNLENNLGDVFDRLKISAFTKLSRLNKDDLREVTIGPNRTIEDADLYSGSYISNSENKKASSKPEESESSKHILHILHQSEYIGNSISKEDNGLPMREIIKDFESDRLNDVQNVIRSHLDKFQSHSVHLEKEGKQKWLDQQAKLIRKVQQEEQNILRALEEDQHSKALERQKLQENCRNLEMQRRTKVAALEAKQQELKELRINVDHIKRLHTEFLTIYMGSLNLIKSCQDSDDFKSSISAECKQLKVHFTDMEEIVKKCKTCKIDTADVKKSEDIVSKIKSLKEQIDDIVDAFKSEELQKAEREQIQIKQKEAEAKAEHLISSDKSAGDSLINNNLKTNREVSSKLDKYISPENLKMYTEIMDFMEKHVQSFKELSENASLKQFKFDCKKAINIPVNAISAVSSQHLKDKYDRLSNLLLGKVVRIGENVQFTASRHPQGVAFCIDLLAKKMVLQSDLMISSNPESAFCYATIIISLWNVIPEVGKLLLSYFYKACPGLVPFNIPKSVDQSDEDFYISQGYQYVDGQIEKQDKYLKRMTGIMRLYAAILVSKPKSDQKTHPHGIENGWKWLASILKLEPQLDITATLIHTFLEVAGYHMQITYKKSFQKLLQIIIVKFLPIMKQNDSGGPVTRLEVLLQEYQQNGQFEKPTGILSDHFW